MKERSLYSALIIGLLCVSCGGDIPQEKEVKEEVVNCNLGPEISYSKQVVPVLEKYCYECHNDEDYAKKADGHKLMGFDNIKKEVDKGLVKGNVLHSKGFMKMPYRRPKLDTCDLAIIVNWVDEGAKNN